MKSCIAILLILIAGVSVKAQTNYLKGAVSEVNGKVVFSKEIVSANNTKDIELYNLVHQWAKDNYVHEGDIDNRILLADAVKLNIACSGRQELIFKSSALSLDRSYMIYQLVMEIHGNKCEAVIRNIYFDYAEGGKEDRFAAETMITDKVALSKDGQKLNRYYDKFRMRAIDSINVLFNSLETYINGKIIPPARPSTSSSVAVVATSETKPVTLAAGSTPISTPDKSDTQIKSSTEWGDFRLVPLDSYDSQLALVIGSEAVVSSGKDSALKISVTDWGGVGQFWGKPVVFTFISPDDKSIQSIDDNEYYTVSFFSNTYSDVLAFLKTSVGNIGAITESGLTLTPTKNGTPTFSEAQIIIECRKVLAQPISTPAIKDKSLADKWSKNGYHKIYIGEIVNMWIK